MTLAFQRIPNINVPRRVVGHDARFHSFPQPGQELSAKCAARLSYCPKNVEPLDEFRRKSVETPHAPLIHVSVPEVHHWKVRENL